MFGGLVSSIVGGASSLLGGIIGSSSSARQNAAVIGAQREAAQKKYQWAVADMEKAGLNPKLAGTQAASVSGANIGSGVQDVGGKLAQGAMGAGNILADMLLKVSQAKKNEADSALSVEQGITQSSARAQMQSDAELKVAQQQLALAQQLYTMAQTAESRSRKSYYFYLAEKTAGEAMSAWHRGNVDTIKLDAVAEWWRNNRDWAVPLELIGSSSKDLAQVFDKSIMSLIKHFVPGGELLFGNTTESTTSVGNGTVRKSTRKRVGRR